MSAISGSGGNYISDGDIMAWLAVEQDRVYGDLQHSMDLSGERANFTDELNKIKADIHDANRDKDFGKVDRELQDFMHKYGSDPNFAKSCEAIKGMADKIHADYQVQKNYAETAAKPPVAVDPNGIVVTNKDKLHQASQQVVGRFGGGTSKPAPQSYDDTQMKDWDNVIGDQTGAASRNDQLTMIHIQQLKATLDQGCQLGSTFISSSDKTSSSIIHNIA